MRLFAGEQPVAGAVDLVRAQHHGQFACFFMTDDAVHDPGTTKSHPVEEAQGSENLVVGPLTGKDLGGLGAP
jgi:hypothetical protein